MISTGLSDLAKADLSASKHQSDAVQKQIESLSDQDKWILDQLSSNAVSVDELMKLSATGAHEITISGTKDDVPRCHLLPRSQGHICIVVCLPSAVSVPPLTLSQPTRPPQEAGRLGVS